MKAQCNDIQSTCAKCMDGREFTTVNVVEDDWRRPIREFLSSGVVPQEAREAEKLRKKAERKGGIRNSNGRDTRRSVWKTSRRE
ncbi:hypothetical protein SESBI_03620 [Sesbania bispinosa]|nr:hypothetical protein SESBI_03620 [Sesbania bispinosa]